MECTTIDLYSKQICMGKAEIKQLCIGDWHVVVQEWLCGQSGLWITKYGITIKPITNYNKYRAIPSLEEVIHSHNFVTESRITDINMIVDNSLKYHEVVIPADINLHNGGYADLSEHAGRNFIASTAHTKGINIVPQIQ